MKRAIITVGLGFGDEGKGSTVDFLVRQLDADLVIRYSGGCQCGHNVELPDGFRHTFSQFGSGTLSGVPTYLDRNVIIDPFALRREARHLRQTGGEPNDLLTIHPRCLVTTVFHRDLNRSKESARGYYPHGSCGQGIGETRSYWLKYGQDAIFAEDLRYEGRHHLRDKLELAKARLLPELSVQARAYRCTAVASELTSSLSGLRLIHEPPPWNIAVFEGAQGVLLDEWYGFHPHTTWSTVTPQHALEMVGEYGEVETKVLGITRTYMTRHGAGPLPTFDLALTEKMKDPGNPDNTWQGRMRCGWLDLSLLRYAASACGKLDGLVVNHLDQVEGSTYVGATYGMCNGYDSLLVRATPNFDLSPDRHEALCSAEPFLQKLKVDEIRERLSQIAPIMIEGSGPTHLHRKFTSCGTSLS